MLRVASVIASLAARTGGPAHNLVDSVGHLRDEGIDVTIFTTDQGAPASARSARVTPADFPVAAGTCDVRVFEAQAPQRFAYAPKLWRALKSDARSFDIVRVHGLYLYPNLAASTVARKADVPYLVTPHGALNPWIRRHGRIRKEITNVLWQNRMLRHAAAIHTMTSVEAELFADVVPVGIPRHVVGNGVELSAFRALPPRGELRERLGLRADMPLLLFLGRVSPEKGVDILIRATATACLRSRGVALVVAGPGEKGLIPRLQTLAQDLGIEERVFFVGPQFGPQRLAALADADIWVLPSHAENFGNVVVEAMAAGVPTVVSTEVNLAPEILAAEAGRISSRDEAEIAKHCAAILDSSSERDRLIKAGRVFAERYDWSRIATQLANMLRDVSR
jgi:glycosyltransferase involved in cell wall biosynthesis